MGNGCSLDGLARDLILLFMGGALLLVHRPAERGGAARLNAEVAELSLPLPRSAASAVRMSYAASYTYMHVWGESLFDLHACVNDPH